jgi:predicted ATP-dependent protease
MEVIKESGVKELSASELYQFCNTDQFPFETTADLEDMIQILGQERAVEAVQFGMGVEQEGYNLFAMGPVGTGKREVVRQFFEQQAAQKPVPSDWCYVHNFDQPHKPQALHLPPGKGVTFRKDMEHLVEELRTALSAAFESEEYQTRRQAIEQQIQNEQQKAFEELQQKAKEKGLALLRTPAGLAFAPVRDGEVVAPEELQNLPEEEQQRMQASAEDLQDELQKILRQVPRWQREAREQLRELNREMTNFAVGGLIDEMREKYADFPKVVDHLDNLQEDVIENARDLLSADEGQAQEAGSQDGALRQAMSNARRESSLRRYKVNLLVDHSDSEGAPIIYEDNPTYQNLIGRVEHMAQMGALLTDFNLIKSGALHQANGGYLILDARKVLLQPYAWEGLSGAGTSSAESQSRPAG